MTYSERFRKNCMRLVLEDNRPPRENSAQGADNSNALKWATIAGIPLAIAFCGWLVTGSIERSKLDTEYIRIAIGILGSEINSEKTTEKVANRTAEQVNDEKLLRAWAGRVLIEKSPVAFTEKE
jgi:hypothetical protein